MKSLRVSLAIFSMAICGSFTIGLCAGCKSTAREADERHTSAPARAGEDQTAAGGEAGMAADDAENLPVAPGAREPSRRPPRVRRERPVDQPRITRPPR